MVVLLRIVFTGGFILLLARMHQESKTSLDADLAAAANLALAIIVGIVAACTWAPVLGARLASPVTDVLTDGTVTRYRPGLMRWIHWAEVRGKRRLTLFLCFLEGIISPDLPGHFIVGMNHAKPGSWLEKVFAREVYGFSNLRQCLRAYDILRLRHDTDPGPHRSAEVDLALFSQGHEVRPETPPLELPTQPPPPKPLKNQRIKLFPTIKTPSQSDTKEPKPDPASNKEASPPLPTRRDA
jgi:hypothetical protein